jgi:hypothetical protein
LGNSYWSRQERGEDWLGESLRVVGTGFWVEVGNGPLVWGQAGRTTPAGGEGHRVRELGKVVSCGGSGEKGWRTELDLSRRKPLDDHHGPATVGTEPKRSGFLGGGGWWLGLRLNRSEGLPAKWQESGPPPVGEQPPFGGPEYVLQYLGRYTRWC